MDRIYKISQDSQDRTRSKNHVNPVLLLLALLLAAPRTEGDARAPAPQEISASYHVLMNGGHVAVMMMYQFMFRRFQDPRRLDFAMTNGRKLDRYRYLIRAGVEIDTPLGRMKTLHLVKQREPDEDGAEIWLAPEHHYLPVRMLIEEKNGSRYEQIIVKLELKP